MAKSLSKSNLFIRILAGIILVIVLLVVGTRLYIAYSDYRAKQKVESFLKPAVDHVPSLSGPLFWSKYVAGSKAPIHDFIEPGPGSVGYSILKFKTADGDGEAEFSQVQSSFLDHGWEKGHSNFSGTTQYIIFTYPIKPALGYSDAYASATVYLINSFAQSDVFTATLSIDFNLFGGYDNALSSKLVSHFQQGSQPIYGFSVQIASYY